MTEARYFLTVDWCNDNQRGILCDSSGRGFNEDTPHTNLEMQTILGPFWIILNPQSEVLTESELAEYKYWRPLAEYSNQFGIAYKTEDVPIREQGDLK